jgi:hypothetical protein
MPQGGLLNTLTMLTGPRGQQVPVDADAVPYVVIPEAGPPDVAGEFTRLTGVKVGDFGVVIANGRTVPVIVADTGPFSIWRDNYDQRSASIRMSACGHVLVG